MTSSTVVDRRGAPLGMSSVHPAWAASAAAARQVRPDRDEPRPSTPAPSSFPALIQRDSSVVALRELDTIAPGALRQRRYATGDRLVAAHDLDGDAWWIPASTVWTDPDHQQRPQRPRSAGLATAVTADNAVLTGLSDRLGWEAVKAVEAGVELPPALGVTTDLGARVAVCDGRLGHDIPTVVVIGSDFVRWAAASTWDGAVHRAIYGDQPSASVGTELGELIVALRTKSLRVATVDLGTPLLQEAGIVRRSVQLVACNGVGRA